MVKRGLIAFIVIIIIIVILWYVYDKFNFVGLGHPVTSTIPLVTTVSGGPSTSTIASGFTTSIPGGGNLTLKSCDNYVLQSGSYNTTLHSSCASDGSSLAVWTGAGSSGLISLLVKGADGRTYINQTTYNLCPTFYKNIVLPPQSYNITFTTGPGGSSCGNATVRFNTSTVSTQPIYNYVYNGNFGTGNYLGWIVNGTGFGTKPINITHANNGTIRCYLSQPWSGYNGTYFASTFNCGLSTAPGNITSSQFLVDKSYLNFKVISQEDANLYVQVLYNNSPYITVHYNTYNLTLGQNASSQFQNETIFMTRLLGKVVRIRVVARTLYRQRYIAVGDFQLSTSSTNYNPSTIVNESETT